MPKNKRAPRQRVSRKKPAHIASASHPSHRNLGAIAFRITGALLILGVTAVLLSLCYLQQFVTFREYDDEGYVLLTLRQFMSGLPLYDHLFTQYGPFPFVWRSLLHAITYSEATHDATRLISIITRLFLGTTCAFFFFRITRNFFLALLLYVQMTVFLVAMVDEPGHPQETVLLLLGITSWSSRSLDAGSPSETDCWLPGQSQERCC